MTDIFKSADWAREADEKAESKIVRIDLPPSQSMAGYAGRPVRWLTREEVRAIWPDESEDAEFIGTVQWGEHTVKGIKP